jgi:hypothetical protein
MISPVFPTTARSFLEGSGKVANCQQPHFEGAAVTWRIKSSNTPSRLLLAIAMPRLFRPSNTEAAMPTIRKIDRVSTLLILTLAGIVLVGPVWSQTATPLPTVRDAYVVKNGKIVRSVRLTDNLTVIVCKAEYEAWAQSLSSPPKLALYLDGVLMKNVSAIKLISGPLVDSDDQATSAMAPCAAADPAVLAAAKEAKQSQADAQAAKDVVAKEKDPTKLDADKKDADDKAERAAAAKEKAAGVSGSAATYALSFYLDPQLVTEDDTKDAWVRLLKQPWRATPITVGAGTESSQWPGEANIAFERLNLAWLAVWALLFVVAIALFIKYAQNSDIIRDTGELTIVPTNNGAAVPAVTVPPQNAPVPAVPAPPGTTMQMAVAAGQASTVVPSTTALTAPPATGNLSTQNGAGDPATQGAATVGGTGASKASLKVPATPRKSYSLARTQMALWTLIVAGALVFIFMVTWNQNSITSGVLILLGVSFGTTLLAAVSDGSQPTPQQSQGFLADLLSDGDGPSFHPYQMLLFTVILAVFFMVQVATNLIMPQFDTTLLGLMGISNGTYLGFKLQGR